jgi:hypothetical protein
MGPLEHIASLIPPTPPLRVTYYIAPGGNDAATCTQAQNATTPKRTWIGLANGCAIRAGDTVYFRAGTYTSGINSNTSTIPSGSSYANPVTIAAYPGEQVVFDTQAGDGINIVGQFSYIIFRDLIVQGGELSVHGGAHHIRYQGGQLRYAVNSCVVAGHGDPTTNNLHITGVEIHHCGTHDSFDHGLYFVAANSVIENNDIHDNLGYGIQFYDSNTPRGNCNGCIVRNNRIHHNNKTQGGMTIDQSDDVEVSNNLFYENGGANGSAIALHSDRLKVYNNTFYGHRTHPAIDIAGTSQDNVIRNNIFFDNGGTVQIAQGGSGTQSNNVTTDPGFADPANGDFRLRSDSPAINTARDLVASNEVTWNTDMEGTTRPKGGAWDMGPLERIVVPPTPPTPTPDDLVTLRCETLQHPDLSGAWFLCDEQTGGRSRSTRQTRASEILDAPRTK